MTMTRSPAAAGAARVQRSAEIAEASGRRLPDPRPGLLLLLILAVGSWGAPPLASQEPEVRAAALRFVDAFNDLDWPAFAESFDSTATIFHPSPMHAGRVNGRVELVRSFEQIFGALSPGLPGPPYLNIRPEDVHIQMLGQDAAIVTFHLRQEDVLGRRTLVFVRREGRWLIAHLHASIVPVSPAPRW